MTSFAVMVAAVPMAAVGAIVVVRIATMVAVVVMVVGVVVSVRTLAPVVRRAGRQPAGQLLHAAGLLAARRVRGRLRRGRARARRRGRRSKHVGDQGGRQDDREGQAHDFSQSCHVLVSYRPLRRMAVRGAEKGRFEASRRAVTLPIPSCARIQSARSRLEPRAAYIMLLASDVSI